MRKKHPLSGVLFYSVNGADEVHAAFLHMYVQADPVAAYVAAGILVDTAILRTGKPLVEKGTAAGGHTQQGGTAVIQNNGLIALVRSEGDDAHMVEQETGVPSRSSIFSQTVGLGTSTAKSTSVDEGTLPIEETSVVKE